MKKRIIYFSELMLFIIFLLSSCMHVRNLNDDQESANKEIKLVLNRLNNTGGGAFDEFHSITTSDNYYIAVGYSDSDLSGLTGGSANSGDDDCLIAKFNKSDLSLVSINNLGAAQDERFFRVITSGDYYIAVGYSNSDLSGFTGGTNTVGNNDFLIAKFNKSDLSLVNLTNLGGTLWDQLYGLVESGSYYITNGSSNSNLSGLTGGADTVGNSEFVILKFNKSDLSFVELNNLGSTGGDLFNALIVSDSYCIGVGNSNSNLSGLTGGSSNQGDYDLAIVKFNISDLSLVHLNNLGGAGAEEFNGLVESAEHYIAVGYSESDLSSLTGGNSGAGGQDFVIARFNKSDLSLDRINNLGGAQDEQFEKVVDSGNYYIAVGHSKSNLSSLPGGENTQGDADFVIAKFNKADLSLVEINNNGGSLSDFFYDLIEADNNYIAVGYSNSDLSGLSGGSNTRGNDDFVLMKFGD